MSRKAIVGKNCIIGENSHISSNVILGDSVIIGSAVRLNNIQIGEKTMIEGGVKIVGTGKGEIIIGKHSYIGVNNILDTSDNIYIGDYVHIAGPSTGIWCHTSVKMVLNSIPVNDIKRDNYRPTAPIKIEDNVYIGGNCTIYPGLIIKQYSVIAPNSAVTKDIDSYFIYGGVPAKKIKKIKPN